MMRVWRWFWAYVFAVASAVLAGLYGFMSASGPYALAKPGILSLVAFFGAHGLAFASMYWHDKRWSASVIAYFATAVCFTVTLWGGLGTFSAGMSTVAAEAGATARTTAIDRKKLERLQGERKQSEARGEATVKADLLTAKSQTAFKTSDGCAPEKITVQSSRDFCRSYRALEAELDRAQTNSRLDADIASTEERLRSAPPEVSADPQASAFSILTGLSVEISAALYALCASIALELAAAVMMLMAHAPPREKVRDTPRNGDVATKQQNVSIVVEDPDKLSRETRQSEVPVQRLPKPIEEKQPHGSVRAFLDATTIAAREKPVSVKSLFTRYCEWCQHTSVLPSPTSGFFDELDELCAERGLEIQRRGRAVVCLGLAFKQAA